MSDLRTFTYHVHDIGRRDGEHTAASLLRQSTDDKGLTRTRRAEE